MRNEVSYKAKKLLVLLLASMLVLSGCEKNSSTEDNESGTSTNNTSNDTTNDEVTSTVINESEMFTDRDFETDYEESKSIAVTLSGDSISCKSDAVKVKDTTITLSEEGTYIFSGSLDDGMIVVNADDKAKLQIVLDDASITSSTSAALYILEADKVFVTLAAGTSNTLANGGTFTAIDDNNIDGTVFSKQDLTFNGSGSLTVTSPADHGIFCKDDLVFTGGTYTVNSASHGLDANDSVRITQASITIASGKDGIHAENSDDSSLGFVYVKDGTFDISAEGDGISSGNSMLINDGTFTIVSGGGSENSTKQSSDSWGNFMGGHGGGMGGPGGNMGDGRPGRTTTNSSGSTDNTTSSNSSGTATSSTTESDDSSTSIKAIKSAGNMLIKGGTFTIDSADDSVHSNASITVNGGTFTIASGDDAFHADETLTITEGTIAISESYEGLEALDVVVSGGNIKLVASDDGLNAAGGTDESGYGGTRGNDQFGGRDGMDRPGGMGGPGNSTASNGSIKITGGNLYINASGDGIDANGSLEISGGYTIVVGPTHGDTATLDYDTSAIIIGGTFIGTGASGMAQTFSDSEQGVVAVSVGNQAAGTRIELKDSKGNVIVSYAPELSFAVVILSNPDIVKGETYTIIVGSTTGEFEAS
ncbi:MAG: carbohydrate-binding domain-containing protein [Tyzzerella sp.]|nr:carbohydrate-binding domain-containing protein [Tyzzerella sp.]